MFRDPRQRLHKLAPARPVVAALAAIAVVAATAAAATPFSRPQGRLMTAVEKAVAQAAPLALETRLVWEGADVDGDGHADFANPTGQAARGHDAYGDGEFGASRDGGARRHEGVDFAATAGQSVNAPISGYITRIGYAYAGDQTLKFIEITNPALRYAARVFYVNPKVQVGDSVALGHLIGTAHSLQRKYPGGMTDHVHLEILDHAEHRIDAARMITAQQETVRVAAD